MPAPFVHQLTVSPEAIDANDHVSNVAYIRWMQEAAIAHSNAVGWPFARYEAAHVRWVVRSHHIEYLQPAQCGDRLTLYTWVADFRRVRSRRKYRFVRHADQTLLAHAETEWVFVDWPGGRPCPILPEVARVFPVLGDDPFA